MSTDLFVHPQSIVRQIWGKSDTILFIFAGASAEFALNKAVDWLYFTGKLPADPLGRLFSTVVYARTIVFADTEKAHRSIDAMAAIHASVETSRGMKIPDWAYRDVLFMLIDYSIRSYEVLERPLSMPEKKEVFDVFYRVGVRMGLTGLPTNYQDWQLSRERHLNQNLAPSVYTEDLYRQYRKNLGIVRYRLLLQVQGLVAPDTVREMKRFPSATMTRWLLKVYRWSKLVKAENLLKTLLLPPAYKPQIKALDVAG